MDCQICCEKLNNSTRKGVQCPSPDCNETICMSCFRRYLLEGGDIEPKCMVCSKKMSYMFVRQQVPITWANKDYLELRTKHLLAREKSLLPESQQDAKEELDRRERQRKIDEIQLTINEYHDKISILYREQRILARKPIKNETKVVTRRRCPDEDCQGFLEDNWKCGLCKLKCCSGCGEKKEEEHECNEETKATFEIIKADTRPCPKCAAPIHKWEGCNQMFCTQCNCMFDYRTGRLETGFFHNPHFFEAMQNGTLQGRGEEGPRCGDIRDYDFVYKIRNWKRISRIISSTTFDGIINVLRLINHISAITLDHGKYVPDDQRECRLMRRDFLLKELEEKEWVKRLKVIEKARERNTEIRQVLELFRDIARDILLNIQELADAIQLQKGWTAKSPPRNVIVNNITIVSPCQYVLDQVNELGKFTDFCNDKFVKFEFYFKNKAPRIAEDWETRHCQRI